MAYDDDTTAGPPASFGNPMGLGDLAWPPRDPADTAPAESGSGPLVVPPETCPSPVGRALVPQALAGLVWCETFVALGMHCFWVLSKSTPLTVDNSWGILLALAPFLTMLLAGLAVANGRVRAAFVRLEPALHWTAALLQCALIFGAVLRNPMQPVIPLTVTLLPWSMGLTFVLLANLATHLRARASAAAWFRSAQAWLIAALALLWWACTLGVASGMTWAVYFWTASLLLHAALAATARLQPAITLVQTRRALPGLETAFLLCMAGLLQVRGLYAQTVMGPMEAKFPVFLAPFSSIAFFAGAAVLFAAVRFRQRAAAHAAVALFVGAAPSSLSWPTALGLGYALPALFLATRRLGGGNYALAALTMAILWLVGLSGAAFAGLIVHFGFYAEEARVLLHGFQAGLGFLLVLWLTLLWRGRNRVGKPARRTEVAASGAAACAVLFTLLLALSALPGAVLLKFTLWPPVLLAQADARPVDAPMGVCHAGYSESDEEYRILDELGVQALRVDFTWSGFESAPGQWDFSSRDGYVAAAVKHGKEVVAILDFDNNAVEEDPAGKARAMYIAPADVPKFLEYVRQTVTHFKDRVDAWEIWNEPDISRFWDGPMEEFYALARQTADTIRIADPAAQIVGTACTGPLGALGADAIEELHATGALADVQHPAGHLYATNPRHYYAEFAKLIGAARRHHHPGSVWITELGAPDGGFYPWCTTDELLAPHVIKAYTIATSLGIDRLVWYCFRDGSAESQVKWPPDSEAFFGLLGPNDQWKPSAHAYSLFSKYCTHSVLRGDAVQLSGGLAARQLRTALYRRDNAPSALVLWYEPALRPWGTARVTIDFGDLKAPPVVRDIASGREKTLTDDHIDLSETPVLLTFGGDGEIEKPVRIQVTGSPVDVIWLAAALGALLVSAALCLHRRRAPMETL